MKLVYNFQVGKFSAYISIDFVDKLDLFGCKFFFQSLEEGLVVFSSGGELFNFSAHHLLKIWLVWVILPCSGIIFFSLVFPLFHLFINEGLLFLLFFFLTLFFKLFIFSFRLIKLCFDLYKFFNLVFLKLRFDILLHLLSLFIKCLCNACFID